MANIELKNFVTKNEKGEDVFDQAGFQSALDTEKTKSIATAVENANKKLEKELTTKITKTLADQAKMSAEEKFKQERLDMEADMQKERDSISEERKTLNKENIKLVYKEAGFSEDEIVEYSKLVTENGEESIAQATKFAEMKKSGRVLYEKEFIEKQQKGQPQGKANGEGEGGNTYAKEQATKFAESKQSKRIEL
jgi:NACalpha-BTF3-like transcription factor